MRTGDHDEDRVAGDGVHGGETVAQQGGNAAGLGLLHDRAHRLRRVVEVHQQQSVESGAPGVEQVTGTLWGGRDVGDERQAREARAQLADPLEARGTVGKEVDDRQVHRLAGTGGKEIVPTAARRDGVLPPDGDVHALEATVERKQRGDDAHGEGGV